MRPAFRAVALTGNYNFFNLLTMLLCVFLFDDAALRSVIPTRLAARVGEQAIRAGRTATTIAVLVALTVVPAGVDRMRQLFTATRLPVASSLTDAIAPLLIVNSYGLFAVMTTTRPRNGRRGSVLGKQWREYEFRYDPDQYRVVPVECSTPAPARLADVVRRAERPFDSPWFSNFLRRLLENDPTVLSLLAGNPFPIIHRSTSAPCLFWSPMPCTRRQANGGCDGRKHFFHR